MISQSCEEREPKVPRGELLGRTDPIAVSLRCGLWMAGTLLISIVAKLPVGKNGCRRLWFLSSSRSGLPEVMKVPRGELLCEAPNQVVLAAVGGHFVVVSRGGSFVGGPARKRLD